MSEPLPLPPRVLTIAGSDSGGGAGIEADLKVCAALGAYGMAAVTAVTAQNTVGVRGVEVMPAAFVAEQIAAVAEDIGVDAAKTGMLANAAIVEAAAESVQRHGIPHLVVDPVMVSKSGAHLLESAARDALIQALLPLATVVTPNLPEAGVLLGTEVTNEEGMRAAAEGIHAMGPRWVLIKGGHLRAAAARDLLYDGREFTVFEAPRIETKNTHGTGCTYSSAIAVYLGMGYSAPNAVREAKAYLTGALRHSLSLGHGHGPLDHAWRSRYPDEA